MSKEAREDESKENLEGTVSCTVPSRKDLEITVKNEKVSFSSNKKKLERMNLFDVAKDTCLIPFPKNIRRWGQKPESRKLKKIFCKGINAM